MFLQWITRLMKPRPLLVVCPPWLVFSGWRNPGHAPGVTLNGHCLVLYRYHDEEHANLLNAMWLIAVTILCVGYGDIVPNTYCGRTIAVACGIMVSKRCVTSSRDPTLLFLTCHALSLSQQVPWRRTCQFVEHHVAYSDHILVRGVWWYCPKYLLWEGYCRDDRHHGKWRQLRCNRKRESGRKRELNTSLNPALVALRVLSLSLFFLYLSFFFSVSLI